MFITFKLYNNLYFSHLSKKYIKLPENTLVKIINSIHAFISDNSKRILVHIGDHNIDVVWTQRFFELIRPRLQKSSLSIGVFAEYDRRAAVDGVQHLVMRHLSSDPDVSLAVAKDTAPRARTYTYCRHFCI